MAMQQEPMDWRYLPYIRAMFYAYREYPHKIWHCMAQYLHFRILNFLWICFQVDDQIFAILVHWAAQTGPKALWRWNDSNWDLHTIKHNWVSCGVERPHGLLVIGVTFVGYQILTTFPTEMPGYPLIHQTAGLIISRGDLHDKLVPSGCMLLHKHIWPILLVDLNTRSRSLAAYKLGHYQELFHSILKTHDYILLKHYSII